MDREDSGAVRERQSRNEWIYTRVWKWSARGKRGKRCNVAFGNSDSLDFEHAFIIWQCTEPVLIQLPYILHSFPKAAVRPPQSHRNFILFYFVHLENHFGT